MIIYHGSEYIIEHPTLSQGKKHNDFGQGFYCTESEHMAKEWAALHKSDGYANSYQFDITGLRVLDLLCGEYNVLNWLAILLQNRTFRIDGDVPEQSRAYILENFSVSYEDSDVVIGYRADDSYFSYAMNFLGNGLSLSNLEKAMKLGNLGEQIFIKSERAFERLEYVGANIVSGKDYYPQWLKRDIEARAAYRLMKNDYSKDVFVMDIVRNNWRNDDVRLQRIVRE